MSFAEFLSTAVDFIQIAVGAVTLYQIFTAKKKKKDLSEKQWENYKKRFKRYIERHPEIGIIVVQPEKKGLATKYSSREK